jgi:hypothetical protein
MTVATVVDIIFLYIFLTGNSCKIDMLNILITMQQFHISLVSVMNLILIIFLSLQFIILCKVEEKMLYVRNIL